MSENDTPGSSTDAAGAGALAATLAELCGLAGDRPADAIKRCDMIVRRFGESALDRRQRASSISALHLAIRNRMPGGPIKSHVDTHLAGLIDSLRREGRYDGLSARRSGFSG